MKILYLHGLKSQPGGVKATLLRGKGHEVAMPALPDKDFGASVRLAQQTYDKLHPDDPLPELWRRLTESIYRHARDAVAENEVKLFKPISDLQDKMRETPAVSTAGLLAKLRLWVWQNSTEIGKPPIDQDPGAIADINEAVISVLRDLERMVGANAVEQAPIAGDTGT